MNPGLLTLLCNVAYLRCCKKTGPHAAPVSGAQILGEMRYVLKKPKSKVRRVKGP